MNKVLIVLLTMLLFSCENKKVEITPENMQVRKVVTQVQEPENKILGVHTVIPKDTLWFISDKWYKDPVLWPSIYEINKDQIEDPDLIFEGQQFDIPKLNVGDNLSEQDRSLLAQGYLEAYRVYKEKGKKDAADYKTASEKFGK